jgi:SAM-dependent methyltransferase
VTDWRWDDTLYRGSADYYAQGRLPYPEAMADALRTALSLDGQGRLMDVGCGPGSVALLLAPLFEQVVGIDADADMLAQASRAAERRSITNAKWHKIRAEDLPAGLGRFRVAIFAQSFHWMDQPRVARMVADMLEPDGAWVHVNATTHRGVETDKALPWPTPPRDRIRELAHRYLGDIRRAGQGQLPDGTPHAEEGVMLKAGYSGPQRVVVPRGEIFERSEDEVVASVYSLSWAAPHLFAEQLGAFEADLRQLLRSVSPTGRFCEQARDIELVIWRRPVCPPGESTGTTQPA